MSKHSAIYLQTPACKNRRLATCGSMLVRSQNMRKMRTYIYRTSSIMDMLPLVWGHICHRTLLAVYPPLPSKCKRSLSGPAVDKLVHRRCRRHGRHGQVHHPHRDAPQPRYALRRHGQLCGKATCASCKSTVFNEWFDEYGYDVYLQAGPVLRIGHQRTDRCRGVWKLEAGRCRAWGDRDLPMSTGRFWPCP